MKKFFCAVSAEKSVGSEEVANGRLTTLGTGRESGIEAEMQKNVSASDATGFQAGLEKKKKIRVGNLRLEKTQKRLDDIEIIVSIGFGLCSGSRVRDQSIDNAKIVFPDDPEKDQIQGIEVRVEFACDLSRTTTSDAYEAQFISVNVV